MGPYPTIKLSFVRLTIDRLTIVSHLEGMTTATSTLRPPPPPHHARRFTAAEVCSVRAALDAADAADEHRDAFPESAPPSAARSALRDVLFLTSRASRRAAKIRGSR